MQDLNQLIGSLQWTKLQSSGLWNSLFRPDSKLAQLFELIHRQQVRTEAEAAALIYRSPAALPKIRQLKRQLKERLLEAVFLFDFQEPGFTDRQKAHFECNRRWATAMTLLSKKLPDLGIEQLELLLRHTRHFEFTDLSMNALYHLRLHYGTLVGDPKKYEQYRDLYREYQELWVVENEVEQKYTDLLHQLANKDADEGTLTAQAERSFVEVQALLQKYPSFRLQLYGRLLELLWHSRRNDYAAVAGSCEAALLFFQQKPYSSDLPGQVFYYQLVLACVHLRDFGRGQGIVRRHGQVYETGSFNWFKVQELYLLLALHTQHYDEAYDTGAVAEQAPGLAELPADTRDMWAVYQGYLHFLAQVRRADRLPDARFRMPRWLSGAPAFSPESRGLHVPLLVLQFLTALREQRFSACADSLKTLEQYVGGQVRRDAHFRSNTFLKMLLQLPPAGFHREAVGRKTERLLQQLSSLPAALANQAQEVEIVPYEDLWEMILELLPNRIVRTKLG